MNILRFRLEDELQRIMRDARLCEIPRLAVIAEHLQTLLSLESWLETRERRPDTPELAQWQKNDIEAAREAYAYMLPEPGAYDRVRVGINMTYEEWLDENRPLELLEEAVDLLSCHV